VGWVERRVLTDGRWQLAPQPLVDQLETLEETAPLVLIPRRQWRHVNSYGGGLDSLTAREPTEVLLNPADAAGAGVTDGAAVRVATGPGRSVVGVARLDDSIRRGALSIPHGREAPNVSDLLSGSELVDALTGMPTYSAVPVTISAA